MWKAAFTGRSETGSVSGRSSSMKKKPATSSSSRRSDDEKWRSEKSGKSSTYGDDDTKSSYVTAPSSRVVAPRGLTESAVMALDRDDDDWEDDDKDARSERKSVRSDGRKHRRRSEKERSRSRSRDRHEKRKSGSRNGKSRSMNGVDQGDERAIPDMGSFAQFPGQYAGGMMGQGGMQEPMMSGALPSSADNQFGPSRADSYGAAADYYLDEGQSVSWQPGVRVKSPNMLVNPDLDHLMTASAVAQPAQDTGHGSAADFYGGKISPVLTAEPQSITSDKPFSSSSSRPSKLGRTSSLGTAAVATAAAGMAMGAAASGGSYHQSQNQQTSASYQQSTTSTARPSSSQPRPTRQTSGPGRSSVEGSYYGPPPQQQHSGTPGKQSSHSNAGLYAAGAAAAGAAGLTAYEMNQHHQSQQHTPSVSPYGGTQFARPTSYGGPQIPQMNGMNGRMAQEHQHYHEHKGPLTRLKDGLFNLISSEEDTIKMEMYTEYIGVCKHCFDPRTSPYDAPRRHHYHHTRSRDSFEDLRKRRSLERMRRSSRENLGRTGSTRVDKDNRYYPSDPRKSSSKTDLVAGGLAAAGVAAGANAMFNSGGKDFDDTYSVKSGHRESSAVRRRSRSSSREKRRRSSHGVVGRNFGEEYVTIKTKDGRVERRRVQRSRSRSRSRDKKAGVMGAAAGAALGASALAAGRSRWSGDHTPDRTFVRQHSGSRSSSQSGEGGIFGGFFSPPSRKQRKSSRPKRRKKEGSFFTFGSASASSSDLDMAFGASQTDLPVRRKSSTKSTTKRKSSDEHLAATVAGIGATAAALAAAQNGQRTSKRGSKPQLGERRDVRISGRHGEPVPLDDEWEDELPSEVEDASTAEEGLLVGDYDRRLSRRHSKDSISSQSSGSTNLSAWGWRWGGKDRRKKRRASPSRPSYHPTSESSIVGPAVAGMAAGAVGVAAFDAGGRPMRPESAMTSTSNIPQQPLQYVDPRPMSDAGSLAGSRHASMPGAFDTPTVARPGPAPIQHPKPVAPIQPAFTESPTAMYDSRPMPTRTQSSPAQSSFAKDAALIGAAAVGTAAVIASQRRRSKDVRFGLTEEQERKHNYERQKEQQRLDDERRRADRARALKEEADRHTREQDVLRAREQENRRAAQAELDRQRAAQREAEEQMEIDRQRERDRFERERALNEEIEKHKRELEEQQRREFDQRTMERRQYEREAEEDSAAPSVPWAAVAAGAAAAGVGAVAVAEHQERESDGQRVDYAAREIKPPEASSGSPLIDDDILDPELFKRSRSPDSRSPDRARQINNLTRTAAGKVMSAQDVVAETDAYYNEPQQTQAEFFAPKEILHQPLEGKTKVADPIDDNEVHVYNATATKAREEFEQQYGGSLSGRTRYAPYGVPKLALISPTPPPSAMSRRSTTPKVDPQAGERPRKSSRSRSISWGTDQTHVYDVPTPDSHHDRDSYIDNRTAASEALQEVVVEPASPDGEPKRFVYQDEADVETVEDTRQTSPSYKAPYFDPVSNIGFSPFDIETPGTEGAPLVRGFVEGETEEPTSLEEKAPHVPGGFDDDYGTSSPPPSEPIAQETLLESKAYSEATSAVSRETDDVAPPDPSTESWEPLLSKKEKKKREKAALRNKAEALDTDPIAPSGAITNDTARDTRSELRETNDVASTVQPAEAWEPTLSKKEKKKREKAALRDKLEALDDDPPAPGASTINDTVRDIMSEPHQAALATTAALAASLHAHSGDSKGEDFARAGHASVIHSRDTDNEPSKVPTFDADSPPVWEPTLGKKDKKKRNKQAKKQGFANIAETMMTTGGIAAVAEGMNDSTSESSATRKGKQGRKTSIPERDIRDIEPPFVVSVEPNDRGTTGMPGSWDADSQDKVAEPSSEAVDPFQYQIHDDDSPPAPLPEEDRNVTVKPKSVEVNDPDIDYTLRSDVSLENTDDNPRPLEDSAPVTNGYDTGIDQSRPKVARVISNPFDDSHAVPQLEYEADDTYPSKSSSGVVPGDLRSIASDPTGDRNGRRKSKEEKSRKDSDYYAEPETYDDTRSVAASEPADVYESSRKSKRRSRHKDDDTTSVVSSGSRREKVEAPKEPKSGFFGLFNRKSTDTVPTSSGAPVSRRSTRDSQNDELDDGERRHRRRKHRDSEYGDEDDTRSLTSETKSTRHRSRDELDRTDRHNDHDRDDHEDGHRRHHRRRTDDGEAELSRQDSDTAHRHHHRRRTEDEIYDEQQPFLGMRVEDMPPLPDNQTESLESAAIQEQGFGNLVSAEPEPHLGSRDHADAFDAIYHGTTDEGPQAGLEHSGAHSHADALDAIHHETRDDQHDTVSGDSINRDVQVQNPQEYESLPALPDSRPGSPTATLDVDYSQRPAALQRPTSTTAVPLRFPFGHQPLTPTNRMERAISFAGSLPTSPATPISAQKLRQGRPPSTEIRPLYLVERNRKTPEVEETLPSLPSSKPSSRASSMIGSDVGSDEYDSAVEEVGSPNRRRALTISTDPAQDVYRTEDDYLDSQQTTPRATEFPPDVFDKHPRQEPQFYTWEDFAREERLRSTSTGVYDQSEPVEYIAPDEANEYGQPPPVALEDSHMDYEDLPALPPSRPESRTGLDQDSHAAISVAAATAAGAAAFLGYQNMASRNESRDAEEKPLEDSPETGLQRSSSMTNYRVDAVAEDAVSSGVDGDLAASTASTMLEERSAGEVESFVAAEQQMEEGSTDCPLEEMEGGPLTETNEIDQFLEVEEQLEEGHIGTQWELEKPLDREQESFTSPIEVAASDNLATPLTDTPVFGGIEQPPVELFSQATESTTAEVSMPGSTATVEELNRASMLATEGRTSAPSDPIVSPTTEAVDRFMQFEEQMEAGQADIVESELPLDSAADAMTSDVPTTRDLTVAGDKTIVSVPEQSVGVKDHEAPDVEVKVPADDADESQSAGSMPKLTRKQSKKAKKKGKAASKQDLPPVVNPKLTPVEPLTDEYAVEDAPESMPPVFQNSSVNEPSTARAPSIGAETADVGILPEALQRRRYKRDSGRKSDALAATTSNVVAIMHTFSDPTESTAARSLTASLGPDEPKELEKGTQHTDLGSNFFDADTQSTQTPQRRPVLRPERSEAWETFPTSSRKQSKKDKKRQQRQQEQKQEDSKPDLDTPTDLKLENEDLGTNATVIPSTDQQVQEGQLQASAAVQEPDDRVTLITVPSTDDQVVEKGVSLTPADENAFQSEADLQQDVAAPSELEDGGDAASNQPSLTPPSFPFQSPVDPQPESNALAAETSIVVQDSLVSRDVDSTRGVGGEVSQGNDQPAQMEDSNKDVPVMQTPPISEEMNVHEDSTTRELDMTPEDKSGKTVTPAMENLPATVEHVEHTPGPDLTVTGAPEAHVEIAKSVDTQNGDGQTEYFARAGNTSTIHTPMMEDIVGSRAPSDEGVVEPPALNPNASPQPESDGPPILPPNAATETNQQESMVEASNLDLPYVSMHDDPVLPNSVASKIKDQGPSDAPSLDLETRGAANTVHAEVDGETDNVGDGSYIAGSNVDSGEQRLDANEEPQEEFTWAPSFKKKAKKAKKGRKPTATTSSVWEEPEPVAPSDNDVFILEHVEASVPAQSVLVDDNQQSRDAEDSEKMWDPLPSKKKKKGKKGKLSATVTPPGEDSENLPSLDSDAFNQLAEGEPFQAQSLVPVADEFSREAAEPEISLEALPAKKKKSKKGKLTATATPSTQEDSEIPDALDNEAFDQQAEGEPMQWESSVPVADEWSREAAEPEISWEAPPAKKKKGKKGRLAATATPPPLEDSATFTPLDHGALEQQAQGEPMLPESPALDADTQGRGAVDPDVLWEVLPVKTKKGKKGKQSTSSKTIISEKLEPILPPENTHVLQEEPVGLETAKSDQPLPTTDEQPFDVIPVGGSAAFPDVQTLVDPAVEESPVEEPTMEETAFDDQAIDELSTQQSEVQDMPVDQVDVGKPFIETIPDSVTLNSAPAVSVDDRGIGTEPKPEPVSKTQVSPDLAIEGSALHDSTVAEPIVTEPPGNESEVGESVTQAVAVDQPKIEEPKNETVEDPLSKPAASGVLADSAGLEQDSEVITPMGGNDVLRAVPTSAIRQEREMMLDADNEGVSEHIQGHTATVIDEDPLTQPDVETVVADGAESAAAEDAESLWAPFTTKKKGKKGKKAKISSMEAKSEANSERDEVVTVEGLATGFTELPTTAKIVEGDDTSKQVLNVPDAEATDVWPTTVQGKKGKKSKKAASFSNAYTEPTNEDLATLQDPQDRHQDQVPESVTAPPELPKDSMEVEPTDIWSIPATGKKAKKGKKNKQAALPSDVTDVVEETPTPNTDSTQEDVADPQEPHDRNLESVPDSVTATPDFPTDPIGIESTDTWSFPVTGKKADKGKKNKRAALTTDGADVGEETPAPIDEAVLAEPNPSSERAVTDIQVPTTMELPLTRTLSDRNMQVYPFNENIGEGTTETITSLPDTPSASTWLSGATPLELALQQDSQKQRSASPEADIEPPQLQAADETNILSDAANVEPFAGDRAIPPSHEEDIQAELGREDDPPVATEAIDFDKDQHRSAGFSTPTHAGDQHNATDDIHQEPINPDQSTRETMMGGKTENKHLAEFVHSSSQSAEGFPTVVEEATSMERSLPTAEELQTFEADDTSPIADIQESQMNTLDAGVVPLPKDTVEQSPEEPQADLYESPGGVTDHRRFDEVMEAVENTGPITDDTPPTNPHENIDFATDVSQGLAESGFDPNTVANDPAFQRQESPPGIVAEADPEEVFTNPSKKKNKGKKGKKTLQFIDTVADEPLPGPSETTRNGPIDDFNETLEKTLAGSGFDNSLLQQAISSSNEISSNEVTGEPDDYSFTTSKRKKGKKAKKAQTLGAAEVPPAPPSAHVQAEIDTGRNPLVDQPDDFRASSPTSELPRTTVHGLTQPGFEPLTLGLEDAMTAETAAHGTATASVVPGQGLEEIQTYERNLESIDGNKVATEDPAALLAIGGDREMDVDDMDRAYKAFKKNKRNKKKQKASASQAETPVERDPLPQEKDLPEQEPLDERSRLADISNIDNVTAVKNMSPDVSVQPSIEEQSYYPGEDALTSSTSPTLVGPNAIPDLQEEKTRTPSPHHSMEEPEVISEPTGNAGPEGYLHTSEASQSLPVVVERSPPTPEFPAFNHLVTTTEQQSIPNNGDHGLGGSQHAWSFSNLADEDQPLPESPLLGSKAYEVARDSGYHTMSSPVLQRGSIESTSRGVPMIHTSQSRESLHSRRSAEPLRISTEAGSEWNLTVAKIRDENGDDGRTATLHARKPSRETDDTPLESTTKNRASYLFQSPPENLRDGSIASDTPTPRQRFETSDYFRSMTREQSPEARDSAYVPPPVPFDRTSFSPPPTGTMSPRAPLDTILEEHHALKRPVADTDATGPHNTKAVRRTQTPQSIRVREQAISPTTLLPGTGSAVSGRSVSSPVPSEGVIDRMPWAAGHENGGTILSERGLRRKSSQQASSDVRSASIVSSRSNQSVNQFRPPEELRSYSRISNRSSTPTLRRIDRSLSGDLRAASRRGEAGSAVGARSSPKTIPFEPPPTPPSNDDEVMDASASRSVEMSDVYQGYGDAQASQASPTRPPNMRKRQSMHIMELESKLDQLAAENQALNDARQNRSISPNGQGGSLQEALDARDLQLRERENEINQIRTMLQPMQDEIARMTEMNNGLTEANRNLVDDTNGRYATLQQDHAQAHEQWQSTSRELEGVRQEHGRLTSGMKEIVEAEIATQLADKNAEIRELREEMDVASEKIRSLQVQIQSSRNRDYLTERDEDYFDGACQKLCQHVQQWVLRFSKMSDNRVCRLSTDLNDDKIEARLDNAILDGSDVDKLLGDRIRRRDVFMSVVMTMTWEYVFTRYLFGMDREQRQKLKSLEKLLAEVGPPRAVAQWRATTLTLLARRPSFVEQRNLDTEAVANEVFGLLCTLLPPPSNAEQQLLASLQKVISIAVDLSIDMRTQRGEFIMLPPLQPEYDINGDLVRRVHFNALLMNERSGMFSSNEELEETHAVVKIVLFPLVVKKGDDVGEGEEETVVCPAQVLVHNASGRSKKIVRVKSGAMEIDDPRRSQQSLLSTQGSKAF